MLTVTKEIYLEYLNSSVILADKKNYILKIIY
jgi:hypothetical protein